MNTFCNFQAKEIKHIISIQEKLFVLPTHHHPPPQPTEKYNPDF